MNARFARRVMTPLRSVLDAVRVKPANLPITLEPELGFMPLVASLAGPMGQAEEGRATILRPARHIPEEDMRAWLAGRTCGDVTPPDWHDGSGGAPVAGVHVARVQDVLHAPEFGAMVTRTGKVIRTSVAEALYFTPTLVGLPFVSPGETGPVITPPRRMPRIDAGAVFVAWGGRFNYGHFLVDCLSALQALEQEGLLAQFPPLAPTLNTWQRAALRLMLGPEGAERVREIASPLVRIDDAVLASPMDHFLHAPGPPLDKVRESMLGRVEAPPTGLSRLYLSRRRDQKRQMVNESELEAELEALGFTVVFPEDYDLSHQIALFRDADVIVAPTGAALANALFCKPGAKVFEIQPINYTGIWVRGLCHLVGADWHAFFVSSPLDETDISIEGEPRPGVLFNWKTPVAEFMRFLKERI